SMDDLTQLLAKWLRIVLVTATPMCGAVTSAHHLPLHQVAIQLMVGNKIKILTFVHANLFARRKVAIQYGHHVRAELAESVVHGRAVKRLLVLVVVIEEGLVDAGSAGDGVGARAGDAVAGELLDGSLQNGVTGLLGPAART